MNKDNYSYDGWNAVKDFNFSVISFVEVYSYAVVSLILFIFFVFVLEYVFPKKIKPQFSINKTDIFSIQLNKSVWNVILFFS